MKRSEIIKHYRAFFGFDKPIKQYDSNCKLIGDGLANKRSVWTVATRPFKEAHFATFPEKLIVDCIKAGCPENDVSRGVHDRAAMKQESLLYRSVRVLLPSVGVAMCRRQWMK